jgi:hypothetical protein
MQVKKLTVSTGFTYSNGGKGGSAAGSKPVTLLYNCDLTETSLI